MKAYFQKRIFVFKRPSGTSMGVLTHKPSWFLYLYDEENPNFKGIGECSIIPGLSIDNAEHIENMLSEICQKINLGEYTFKEEYPKYPSLRFAVETAYADFKAMGSKILYPSKFTQGVDGMKINGLIWMGNYKSMHSQIVKKIDKGFSCIKIKIGAIDTEEEFKLLKYIRSEFDSKSLEIRVDANGAFSYKQAKEVLKHLRDLEVHSIEQPIRKSQMEAMAELCLTTPVPIALDEELLGVYPFKNKLKLIDVIRPQCLVLKPGMLGGYKETLDWINIAKCLNIDWWITSALESNIGLNAIAQWTYSLGVENPQGLGTGSLYNKNIDSPLTIKGEKIFYDPDKKWNYEFVY